MLTLAALLGLATAVCPQLANAELSEATTVAANSPLPSPTFSRSQVLVASLTVFVLSVLIGFEVISKVPPTLHTPLMSGSNAISGITVVGALIATGHVSGGFGVWLGLIAVVFAMINVAGGFLVTHRMLLMFKKK
jgi:NAD(P) transhydrogenase subunit alpha